MHLQLLRNKPYKIIGSQFKILIHLNSMTSFNYHDEYYQVHDEDTGILLIVPKDLLDRLGGVKELENELTK